jgi:phosphoglycerate kinase
MGRAILKNKKAHVVVGGGETITSLRLLQPTHSVPKNIFLSTGGGAMLEYLSGKKLPGIVALEKNKKQ